MFGRSGQTASSGATANLYPEQYLTDMYGAGMHFLGRTNLGSYGVGVDHTYDVPAHVDIMLQTAEAVERGDMDRVMVSMPPRHSKPIWDEEPVLMADGTRKALRLVKVGEKVITHRGRPKLVSAVHEQGLLKTLRITTASGRVVHAAPSHPFLTPQGWKTAESLTTQDILAVKHSHQIWESTDRHLAEFILAGYFIGDGSTNSNQRGSISCSITNEDKEVIEDFTQAAKSLGFTVTHNPKYKLAYHFKDGARKWLQESDGLIGNSRTKRVPEWIFKGTKEQIAAFVGSYFACDGTVFKKGSGTRADGYERKHFGCEFGSVNYDLLRDVQHLLLRLGISARLKYKRGMYLGNEVATWRLTLASMHETAKFAELIRVVGAKRKRFNDYGIQRTQFDPEFFSDPIEKIEESGKLPCRCLTVEDDHTFIVSDLVVHNSETWTIKFPGWFLGRNPDKKVMIITHTQSLADRMGGKVRDLLKTDMHKSLFPECILSNTTKGKHAFETTAGGEFFACGVDGGATGRGADLLIIDDPIATAQDAYSKLVRKNVIEFYRSVAYTRLQPGGRIVVIMTRWHEGDLIGWLLDPQEQEQVEDWNIINFPAVAERDEGWRKTGDPLWPEMWPLKALKKIKAAKGDWDWAAQYQQRPSEVEGRLIKRDWFKYYAWAPSMAADRTIAKALTQPFKIYQSWDTAFEEDQTSDYSVCTTWLSTNSGEYLLDVYRKKMIAPDLYRIAEELAFYWRPHAILVEKKASGHSLIQMMSAKTQLPIIACNPQGNKFVRAQAVSPYIQSGHIFIPHQAPWLKEWLNEMVAFPTAAHDDQVDSVSQYLNWITQVKEQQRKFESASEGSEEFNPYDR